MRLTWRRAGSHWRLSTQDGQEIATVLRSGPGARHEARVPSLHGEQGWFAVHHNPTAARRAVQQHIDRKSIALFNDDVVEFHIGV